MRIVIFGDSIAHGLWDPGGGWVQRIRSSYDAVSIKQLSNPYTDVYNLSVAGETAQGVARRLAIEMKARHLNMPTVIVIAVGINDTMIFDGVETNSTELFEGELQQITAAAVQFTDKLLYVGLSAVDDKACDPWRSDGGTYCFNNGRIKKFENVLRDHCKENGIAMVRIFETFQKQLTDKKLLADGLHPNSEGHQLIADIVKPELDKLLSD